MLSDRLIVQLRRFQLKVLLRLERSRHRLASALTMPEPLNIEKAIDDIELKMDALLKKAQNPDAPLVAIMEEILQLLQKHGLSYVLTVEIGMLL